VIQPSNPHALRVWRVLRAYDRREFAILPPADLQVWRHLQRAVQDAPMAELVIQRARNALPRHRTIPALRAAFECQRASRGLR